MPPIALLLTSSPATRRALVLRAARSSSSSRLSTPSSSNRLLSSTSLLQQHLLQQLQDQSSRLASGNEDGTTTEVAETVAEVLFSPPTIIKGVGATTAQCLGKLKIFTILDLLLHLPVNAIDRTRVMSVKDARENEIVTLALEVKYYSEGSGARWPRPLVVHCADELGDPIDLKFLIGASKPHLAKFYMRQLPLGSVRLVSGKVSKGKYDQGLQMYMPSKVEDLGSQAELCRVDPVYRLTEGLTANKLRDIIREGFGLLPPNMPDWLHPEFLKTKDWPSFREALEALHYPESVDDLHLWGPARQRLAFDELLAMHLPLAIKRASESLDSALALGSSSTEGVFGESKKETPLTKACLERLVFELTPSQKAVVEEVWADLASGRKMARLLQGDVGSGKTICALLSLLRSVEMGSQGALLAPTELLAYQHRDTITAMCQDMTVTTPDGGSRPTKITVLTSSTKRSERKAILEELKKGNIDILIGTHSLLSEEVEFNQLGLVVIDEEHRFGVQQRERLSSQSNVLYMSATPIPRTFLLAMYGHIEISRLESIPNKKVVQTHPLPLARVEEVMRRIRERLIVDQTGDKVFWVLPCIDEKNKTSTDHLLGHVPGHALTSVNERYQSLLELLGPERVQMVHGRMDAESKRKALKDFSEGKVDVLVCTSVIEVGVDVPSANFCIVEHAEAFGVMQVHQLRGRVGRATGEEANNGRDCYCILLFDEKAGNRAVERLSVLQKFTDGFEIAEQDFRLRGPGEVLGTRQSGFKDFKFADLVEHRNLAEEAYEVARAFAFEGGATVALNSEKAHLHLLLRLFEAREAQVTARGSISPAPRRKSTASSSSSSTASTTTSTSTRGSSTRSSKAVVEESPGLATPFPASLVPTPNPSSFPSISVMSIAQNIQMFLPERPDDPGWGVEVRVKKERKVEIGDLLEQPDCLVVVVDTETTGISDNDRVIQFAAKVYSESPLEEGEEDDKLLFVEYVDPGPEYRNISAAISAINKITAEVLLENDARPFPEVWAKFSDWINGLRCGRPVLFAAHNAKFDRKMLLNDIKRNGLDGQSLRETLGVEGILCTLNLMRDTGAWDDNPFPRPTSFKQEDLYRYVFGEAPCNAHNAGGDVTALVDLLRHEAFKSRWRELARDYVFDMDVKEEGGDKQGTTTLASSSTINGVTTIRVN